jgi:hypothetical protein
MCQQKEAIDLWECLARGTLAANAVLPLKPTGSAIVAPSQGIDAPLKISGDSNSLPMMRRQIQNVGSTKSATVADPMRCKDIGQSGLDFIEDVFRGTCL